MNRRTFLVGAVTAAAAAALPAAKPVEELKDFTMVCWCNANGQSRVWINGKEVACKTVDDVPVILYSAGDKATLRIRRA